MSTRQNAIPTLTVLSGCALLMLLVAFGAIAGEADREQKLNDGSLSYNRYCQSCHGARGEGDGQVAQYLKVPPADLTRISARRDGEFPDEEIFAIIDGRKGVRGHGGDMPIWGDAFRRTEETDEEVVVKEKIDALVTFLETMQREPSRAAD